MSTPPLTMGAATSEKSWTARTASENKSSIAFVIVAPRLLPGNGREDGASGRSAGARAQATDIAAASLICKTMIYLCMEAAAAIAAVSQSFPWFWWCRSEGDEFATAYLER